MATRPTHSLYPFIEDSGDNFSHAAKALATALATVQPFKVTFPRFQAFMRKRSCTVWLQPEECDGQGSLDKLHSALISAFPECDDTVKAGSGGFTPHLSVGQFGRRAAKSAVADFTTQREAAGDASTEWDVTHVFMISRASFTDPFHVRWRVPLGGGEPEAVAEGDGGDWVTDGAVVLPDGTLSSQEPQADSADAKE